MPETAVESTHTDLPPTDLAPDSTRGPIHPIGDPAPAAIATPGAPEPKDASCVAAYRAIRVLHILEQRTGEGKGISMTEIIEELEEPGLEMTPPVRTGRKALFSSISALRAAGYRIEHRRPTGYHLLTRTLPDEEIVRLLAIIDRNRTTPAEVKRSMSLHLAALASADIIEHLDLGETEVPAPAAPARRSPRPTVGARELIERAIAQAMPVIFDIVPAPVGTGTERKRCALQPVAIRERGEAAYVLGTVIQGQGAEDALRTVALERMRNIECRLLDGSKLMAALDTDEGQTQAA